MEALESEEVISPSTEDSSVKNKKASQQKSNKLNQMYKRILDFIDTDCEYILQITHRLIGIKGFHFLANSIWSEVVETIIRNIPSIFSPAFPDSFVHVCLSLRVIFTF